MKREEAHSIDTLQDARLRKTSRAFQNAIAIYYDISERPRKAVQHKSYWEAEDYIRENKNILGELLSAGGDHLESAIKMLSAIIEYNKHARYVDTLCLSAYDAILNNVGQFAGALGKKQSNLLKKEIYTLFALIVNSPYVQFEFGHAHSRKLLEFLGKNIMPLLNDFLKEPSKNHIDILEYIMDYSKDDSAYIVQRHLRTALDGISRENTQRFSLILGYCAASNRSEISNIGIDALEKFLASYNLDAEALVEAWCQGESRSSLGEYITHNLHTIIALEKKEPSSATVLLKEFGIHHFARYPFEILLRQYLSRDDHSKPYGIALMPMNDRSGAFTARHDLWISIDNQLRALGHRLRISEIRSRIGLLRRLIASDRRYGDDHKISFMLIGAHGYTDGIQPGGRFEKDIETSDLRFSSKKKGIYRPSGAVRSRMFFTNHPSVVIWSCSTGKDGGVAQKLSRILNTEVSAPLGVSFLERLKISLEHDRIRMVPEYAREDFFEVKRMTYRSGKRVIEKKEDSISTDTREASRAS